MPLNQRLYDALEYTFRDVRISDPGEPASVRYTPNWEFKGRPQVEVIGGEYYYVSCPFCSDTRQRLAISHRWNTLDGRTERSLLHLANCFNEGCVDTREKQVALRKLVFGSGRAVSVMSATSKAVAKKITRDTCLPGPAIPITDRKRAVDAIIDLEDRSFNIRELQGRWGVYYSPSCTTCTPNLYKPRIVIPIIHAKRSIKSDKRRLVVVGWQARAIEPVQARDPKYLTEAGMRKSDYLYGIHAVPDTDSPIVVCEGPTDVWRLGTNAVATLGKSASRTQLELLGDLGRDRPIVICLDSGTNDEAQRLRRDLLSAKKSNDDTSKVVIARLPDGRDDIGECTRREAWQCVATALSVPLNDLPVKWRKLSRLRLPQRLKDAKANINAAS